MSLLRREKLVLLYSVISNNNIVSKNLHTNTYCLELPKNIHIYRQQLVTLHAS